MALTTGDLQRLEKNISAAQTWVEGDSTTDAVANNGRVIKSISKVNAEAVTAFNSQLQSIALKPPVTYAGGLTIDEATDTVDYNGVIYAPLPNLVPFTTPNTFDPNQWYVVQGLTRQGLDGANGRLNNPIARFNLKNKIDFVGDGTYTFTRSTVATYINRHGIVKDAAIDQPRFEDKGLLVEAGSTNLMTYSEQLDSGWTTTGTSISADSATAPDLSVTADLMTEDTSTGLHRIFRTISGLSNGLDYTFSVFVKANGRTNFQIALTSGAKAFFDISAASVISFVNGAVDARAKKLANGWVRCSMTAPATSTSETAQLRLINDALSESYTGDGSSGVYLWGMQVEQKSFPTSYIRTVSAVASRTSERLVVSGADNAPGNADFTIYGKFSSNASSAHNFNQNIATISDGSANNRIHIALAPSDKYFKSIYTKGGAFIYNKITIEKATTGTEHRFAISRKSTLVLFYVDGVKTSTTATIGDFDGSVLNTLDVGTLFGSSDPFYGHISQVAIYDFALTDDEAALL